ncbi:MAG: L-2-hydroxyglutarate oxidase [Microthrixaceae bacterium]
MSDFEEPMDADVVVVGGGIVGLAVAWAARQRRPHATIVVVEQERAIASHQSGHNSGVLHSGLYYRPGSAKAALAVRGRRAMVDFAVEHDLPHRIGGKVVLATSTDQLDGLDQLARRGEINGVALDRLGPSGLADHEPHAAGVAGLYVPATGVIDYRRVAHRLAETGPDAVLLGRRVHQLVEERHGVTLHTDRGTMRGGAVVVCAGLWADRLPGRRPRPDGASDPLSIVPFRGEYHRLRPNAAAMVKELIYPVPDPTLPFLGVHLSRGVDHVVHAGPNACWPWPRRLPAGPGRSVGGRQAGRQPGVVAPGRLVLAGRHRRGGEVVLRHPVRLVGRRAGSRHHRDDLCPSPAGVAHRRCAPTARWRTTSRWRPGDESCTSSMRPRPPQPRRWPSGRTWRSGSPADRRRGRPPTARRPRFRQKDDRPPLRGAGQRSHVT